MAGSDLDVRLTGTPRTRFLLELFGNSAQFPIANILLESLLEGPLEYLRAPDLYAILFAGIAQAWWLSRRQLSDKPMRFLGNLIGPALYTLIEVSLEGSSFFESANHIAYWFFALAIGALQAVAPRLPGWASAVACVFEDVVRAGILLTMYGLFEAADEPTRFYSLSSFIADGSHQFVALATLLFGLSLGLSSLTARGYLNRLRETSARLKTYSEWLLGQQLLTRLMEDPASLTLRRQERAVLFMDIRSFTAWSEESAPENVVQMLNRYYHLAETVLIGHSAIKFKFAADEVLAIFDTAGRAAAAAQDLRAQTQSLLAEFGLAAGIGLHAGPLVEGLLGSMGMKFYDVIGDTVNTAKRIESAAAGGEVLVSESVRRQLDETFAFAASREVSVKGKQAPLRVFPLLADLR
jgi:class 3 adenylate cyclase